MKRGSAWFGAVGLALLLPPCADAQDVFLGDWRLTIPGGMGASTGVLTVERSQGGAGVYVGGAPVSSVFDGDTIEFEIAGSAPSGARTVREMRGELRGDRIVGTWMFGPGGGMPFGPSRGEWRAERIHPATAPVADPEPVDFSGTWVRSSGGIGSTPADLTPEGQAVLAGYHHFDDVSLRCVSPGLTRLIGAPYLVEIIQTDDRQTWLHEMFGKVRRIHLDGRERPENRRPEPMGYSLGHWEGSTLVVETGNLKPDFLSMSGQPLSGGARVTERLTLSEDGVRFFSEIEIRDPQYYARPVIRHYVYSRRPDTPIPDYECDPYGFFRGLAVEGALEAYWARMRATQ